jgi:hypothetical protein
MKRRVLAVVIGLAVVPALPGTASAHRSGCHGAHSCPSDHATYKWRGKLCVKPTSDERTRAFKKKVRYAGLTYYCK